jgi:three-Cys-motif partner protein
MPLPSETIWDLEPHTGAKHALLRFYLQRWFRILGTANKTLNYIDGFCGPGRYKGGEPGSPLVAIEAARGIARNVSHVNFLFTDERPDRIKHLESELAAADIPPNFRIVTRNEAFADRLTSFLNKVDARGGKLDPTFVFIDPFGFAGVPYTLVKRILEKPKCETFITFMINSVNRFLAHPEENLRQHMSEIFGTDECFQIGDNRFDRLRNLYQEQLKKAAEFVRYFEMRNRQNNLVYLLFFATNNRLGHIKMKEAMWSVDPHGEVRFSDRTSAQTVLFAPNQAELLWPLILQEFRATTVTAGEVRMFVEDRTAFLVTHMKAALLDHESLFTPDVDPITVDALKADGTKRIKRTYPDGAVITFPK